MPRRPREMADIAVNPLSQRIMKAYPSESVIFYCNEAKYNTYNLEINPRKNKNKKSKTIEEKNNNKK